MSEEEEEERLLAALDFDVQDIKRHSSMRDESPVRSLESRAALSSNVAFNNPGAGTTRVTTSPVDGRETAMKAHYIAGGGQAEWIDQDGTIHAGPKFTPGEKRQRQKGGLSARKLKALQLKTDEPFAIIQHMMRDSMRKENVNVYIPSTVFYPEHLAHRLDGGRLGAEIVYVIGAVLWDMLSDEYLLTDGEMFAPLESEQGFVRGGHKVDLNYLETVICALYARWAKEDDVGE